MTLLDSGSFASYAFPLIVHFLSERHLPNFIDKSLKSFRQAWANDLDAPGARFKANLDMLFVDHGVQRLIYSNRTEVAPGFERMGHPTPSQLKAAKRRGVKTIINLRGDGDLGSTVLSKAACKELGLEHRFLKARSRGMPTKEMLRETARLLDEISYPALIHCKSGADRAGLVSALYMLLREKATPERALEELSLKYGHIRQAKTGMLDFFLEAYRDRNLVDPIDFMDWVETVYDEEEMRAAYFDSKHNKSWANFVVDFVLRRE